MSIINFDSNLSDFKNTAKVGYTLGLNYQFLIDSLYTFSVKVSYSKNNTYLYIKTDQKYANYLPIDYVFNNINISGSYDLPILKSKKLHLIFGAMMSCSLKTNSINLKTHTITEDTKDFRGVFVGLNLGVSFKVYENNNFIIDVQNENYVYPYLKASKLFFVPILSLSLAKKI